MTMPLLAVTGLVKRFGALTATDSLSLAVAGRGVHAVIGPNGAGKSTLIGLLAGALAPDAGEIRFMGESISRLPGWRRARLGLTRSFQVTSLFGGRTVAANLALALQAQAPDALSLLRTGSRADDRGAVAAVAAQVGLADALTHPVARLSHGQLRLLEVGLALACDPKLLLLDEPMAGLGMDESARMEALIDRLRSDRAILLVEHDMDAVFRLADTISVLVAGRIIASGPPDAIRRDPDVRRAYLGDEAGAEQPLPSRLQSQSQSPSPSPSRAQPT